jgi:lysozyme
LYGPDLSNNNGSDIDMQQVANEGFDFVFLKVSEGDYFADSTWPAYRDAAAAAGLLVLGYHYAIAGCGPAAQVATWMSNDGGNRVMIDFEANSGGIVDFWALVRAFNDAGVTVVRSYFPQWYWRQIGMPSLVGVPGLIASSYVGGSGFASNLYPGDGSPMWGGYGGAAPDILQFSDQALIAGHRVDVNAFRGTRSELAAALGYGGFFMALTDAEQAELLQKTREVWDQLRGPNGQGWPQLGTDDQGNALTPVDKLAKIGTTLDKVAATATPAKAGE